MIVEKMMRISRKLATIITIGGVLATILILPKTNLYKADERTKNIESQKATILGEQVTVELELSDSQQTFVRINQMNNTTNALSLVGKDYTICNEKYHLSEMNKGFLCLEADAGVHSRRLYLIEYSNNTLKYIRNQTDGIESDYFISDLPNFETSNIEGVITFAVDSRNYDKDPLKDIVRSNYLLNQSNFTFDKKIELQYD